MIKQILTLMFILAFSIANSQTPRNFLKQDLKFITLKGDTVSIFKELEQNKTVIIDISASWCPPCWRFHETKILDSLHVRKDFSVLLIEADTNTGDSLLYGKGRYTRGDWTKSNYPIINIKKDSDLTLSYDYYPTVYMILPSKEYMQINSNKMESVSAVMNTRDFYIKRAKTSK